MNLAGGAPGLIMTREIEEGAPPAMLARNHSTRHGHAGDVAGMAAYLLSDEGAWINGQVIKIDGGTVLR
ncbi:SDR family oxidoreductase [Streptomyces sp. 2A115]|uniref:SDR family oxidoreductase n=1 Tax=Streptomyces sp. 2A115 TaxID=3457439 RepID=UPI003FCF4002